MKTLTGLIAEKYFLDPIHGPIPITPVELEVISTPIFQRLRSITQLSLASLVYHGATHNRFQHSIGTLHIMDKLLYTLKLDGKLPLEESQCFRIIQLMRLAALLHDCGHLPFSHTFENLYEKHHAHEFFGKFIVEKSEIGTILEKKKIDSKSIGALITGNALIEDPNFNELIELLPLLGSDADADRMDYLLRDAYFTGVTYGKFDLNRICNFISLKDGQICFLEKAQDALEDFLISRYQMYKVVYVHKTVVCYDLLLHKMYKYITMYSEKIKNLFLLPKLIEFENASEKWFNEFLYNLNESSFFKSIYKILNSSEIEIQDKKKLNNLYTTFTKRIPIKNCYRKDDLSEISEREYCDKESALFQRFEEIPEIIEHWSFLRHDPSNPLQIASPIKRDVRDQQDSSQIRILITKSDSSQELILLQDRPNSFIQNLARHHRVLICYYHQDENSQKKIQDLANEFICKTSV